MTTVEAAFQSISLNTILVGFASIATAVFNQPTATTLTSSLNPSTYGQSVTFTATVTTTGSGTPSGTVAFKDGTATLCTSTLSGTAVATCATAALTAGSHSITAVYNGVPGFVTSTSPILTQTVAQATTTTTVAASRNPILAGQRVLFTATTTPSTVTGTVAFKDGTTTLNTTTVSGGQASFATTALALGSHSMTTVYSGDPNYLTSTSSALSEVVNTPPAPIKAFFAANGLDSNPCTQASPCLTFSKAQSLTYTPGSTINFRGGDSFTGCWALNSTNVPSLGISTSPILVQSYGTGSARFLSNCPGLMTQTTVDSVSGVTVQNLILSGNGQETWIGVRIVNTAGFPYNVADTVIIQNNDISGFYRTPAGQGGGEVFVDGGYVDGSLNNIQVLNNQLHGAAGVTSPDDFGIYGFAGPRNVRYAGNHIYNLGGHPNSIFAGDGIVANGVRGGVLEFNLVHDLGANANTCGGPAGIWGWMADNIIMRYNEVYNVRPVPDPGIGCDWAAFDFDDGVQNSIVEYNYSHDNAGLAVLFFPGAGTTGPNTARYNISENDNSMMKGRNGVINASGLAYIYNNTIYQSPGPTYINFPMACFAPHASISAGSIIANNICWNGKTSNLSYPQTPYIDADNAANMTGVTIRNNLWWSNSGFDRWHINAAFYNSLAEVQAAGWEQNSRVANPNLVNGGAGGNCTWTPNAAGGGPQPCPSVYKLTPGSPGLNAGANLQAAPYNLNVGTRDYWNKPITTTPHMGADGGPH
jgi:hypothetical protein